MTASLLLGARTRDSTYHFCQRAPFPPAPESVLNKANIKSSFQFDVSLELVHVFVPEKDTGNRDRPYDCALLGKSRDEA
jgi:hypothetical protein